MVFQFLGTFSGEIFSYYKDSFPQSHWEIPKSFNEKNERIQDFYHEKSFPISDGVSLTKNWPDPPESSNPTRPTDPGAPIRLIQCDQIDRRVRSDQCEPPRSIVPTKLIDPSEPLINTYAD